MQPPPGVQMPPIPPQIAQMAQQFPPQAQAAGAAAWQAAIMSSAQKACQLQLDAYNKRMREKKEFCDTLALIIEKLWKSAALKRQARRWVRSALTVGIGWMKVSWYERQGKDPVILQQISDIQDNIKRADALKHQIDEGGTPNDDAQLAEWKLQMQGLQAKVEETILKGIAADFVRAENITVSEAVDTVMDYLNAPFMSHRCYMRPLDVQAMCPSLDLDELKKAASYSQRKPAPEKDSMNPLASADAADADEFIKGNSTKESVDFLCVEEVWDRDSLNMLTLVEGIDTFGRPPIPPHPTFTRFFPFVGLALTEVDGERHPQSLNYRSQSLQDEFNRARSGFAEHRRRVKPKMMFNRKIMSPADAKKLEAGVTGEMVGINPVGTKVDMRTMLNEVAYPAFNPAIYETKEIMQDFELIWGTQEALSGAISVEKTATEAEIQDKGTNARITDRRDMLEQALTEIAQMTAEAALEMMPLADVQEIAGPESFWPEGMTVDQLHTMCEIDIRAGSSGKPDTAMDRQAWAQIAPELRSAIMQIGQMRQASPSEIADKLEELVVETVERIGDRLEVDRFIPHGQQNTVGAPPLLPPPMPIQETALMGPQATALLAMLADTAAKLIPIEAGMAAVMASFPHFDTAIVQKMFATMANFTPMPKPAVEGANMPGVPTIADPQVVEHKIPQT